MEVDLLGLQLYNLSDPLLVKLGKRAGIDQDALKGCDKLGKISLIAERIGKKQLLAETASTLFSGKGSVKWFSYNLSPSQELLSELAQQYHRPVEVPLHNDDGQPNPPQLVQILPHPFDNPKGCRLVLTFASQSNRYRHIVREFRLERIYDTILSNALYDPALHCLEVRTSGSLANQVNNAFAEICKGPRGVPIELSYPGILQIKSQLDAHHQARLVSRGGKNVRGQSTLDTKQITVREGYDLSDNPEAEQEFADYDESSAGLQFYLDKELVSVRFGLRTHTVAFITVASEGAYGLMRDMVLQCMDVPENPEESQ